MAKKKNEQNGTRKNKKPGGALLICFKLIISVFFLWFFLRKGFAIAPFLSALRSVRLIPAALAVLIIFLKDYLIFTLLFWRLLYAFGSRANFREIFTACAAETSLAFVMPVKSATLLRYYLFLPGTETKHGIASFFLIEQSCIVLSLLGLSSIGVYLSFSRQLGLLFLFCLLFCLSLPHLLIRTRISRLIGKEHVLSRISFITLEFMTRKCFYQILAGFFIYFSLAVIGFYLCARSLNVPISLLNCFLFYPLILFATKLPVTLSGIGIREFSVQFFFQKLSKVEVLGISWVHLFVEYMLPSLFGLFFLPRYFKLIQERTLSNRIPGKRSYSLLNKYRNK
jgi:uncharacterized membrane protein YbhN (UPF0104 family)